jgi:catalase
MAARGEQSLGSPELVDDVLDVIDAYLRAVPSFRRTHARGASFRGRFTATPEAAALSTAEHLQGDTVDTIVRLSNGSPCPYDPDHSSPKSGSPIGIGVRFELPSGGHAALAALSVPAFPPRDPQDFLALCKVQKPTVGDKPNPLALIGFALRRRHAIPGLRAVATHPPRASFATTSFNGLSAFFAVDSDGVRRAFRYRLVPRAGLATLDRDAHRKLPPQFLLSEMKTRLQDAPVEWDFVFQMAERGDPTDDMTKHWPETRRQVTVGRLVVDPVYEDQGAADRLVYDPTNLPPGIEPSADPILHFRSHAYTGSFKRRTSEDKPKIVPEQIRASRPARPTARSSS